MASPGQTFLQGRALRETINQNRFAQEQAFVQQNADIANALITSASEIQKNATAVGKPVDLSAFRERLEGLVTSAGAFRSRNFQTDPELISRSIENALTLFDAAIATASTVPSAEETARTEAKAEVAGAVQTAESLTAAGRATSVVEAARGADLLPEDSITVREIADEEGNKDLIVLDKAGNTIRTIQGGPDVELTGEFTKGSKKEAESRVLSTTELLRNTATLSGLLQEGTVGAIPALRGFLNTTVAQFAPDAFDNDRAEFERFTKITRQAALRTVSDEARFSEADRDFIFELFPKTGPFESVQNASVKLLAMQAFFLKRLGPDLLASGLDPKQFDTGLQPDVVRDATLKGFLTEEQAVRMLEMIWPELFSDG